MSIPTIQKLFQSQQDEKAFELMMKDFKPDVWNKWSNQYLIIRNGMIRMGFWERIFEIVYPLIYERLTESNFHMQRALKAVRWIKDTENFFWCRFFFIISKEKTMQKSFSGRFTLQGSDEFGGDFLHTHLNYCFFSFHNFGKIVTPIFEYIGPVLNSWPLSHQGGIILHYSSQRIRVYKLLHGNPILDIVYFSNPHVFQSEAGVTVMVSATGDWVILDESEPMFKRFQAKPVNAGCFILNEALIVYNANEKELQLHKRHDFHSFQRLLKLDAHIIHMTGLYNVLAILNEHGDLGIYKVGNQHLERLHLMRSMDTNFAPLLYGPFCFAKKKDAGWCKITYEGIEKNVTWLNANIRQIKMATLRYHVITDTEINDSILFIDRDENNLN